MQNISKYLKLAVSKKQRGAYLLFLTLALMSIIVGTYFINNKLTLKSTHAAYTATLSFTPENVYIEPGQTFNVSVALNNGGQALTGADVIFTFDATQLTLESVTPGTSSVFKTFTPITGDGTGAFDSARVIGCANTGIFGGDSSMCPKGIGSVQMGIASFDWATQKLVTVDPSTTNMNPVATFTFLVKSTASGSSRLSFTYDGQGNTLDSNTVSFQAGSNPQDVLSQPTSQVNVTIASPTSTPEPPTSTPIPTSTPVPTRTPTPTPFIPSPPPPTPTFTPTPTPTAVPPTPTFTPTPTPTFTPTPTRTPTPVPPTAATSTITVYAAGTAANGIYPNMQLMVNGSVVGSWTVMGNPKTRAFQAFSYQAPVHVDRSQVRVYFTNDLNAGRKGGDRNLMVDRIVVDGVSYQTEATSTYSTGGVNAKRCSSGYFRNEWLYCNGYFQY